MNLVSTGQSTERIDFRTAVKRGLAPDGGLYLPESIPVLPRSFWAEMHDKSISDVARRVFDKLLKENFNPSQLDDITERAFTFDAPVVGLDDDTFILELFHGPTLAFKDFGARTMAAMLSVMAQEQGETITIVTATSGDTGAAVAHGFYKTPGVEVYVFYPGGQVSSLQEKQFATLGENITALKVDGTFDDCQRLVKACFIDEQIRSGKQLTTANSINIARLLPQMIYYIHAVARLTGADESYSSLVCSVPSGNFGNLTAGLLAYKLGLPVKRFVAATNSNHIVPDYLQDGIFRPQTSIRTISNAMDVGNPSNFDRMLALYDHDHRAMAQDVHGAWYDDEQTGEAIVSVWNKYGYLMDPHTAVGYLGCRDDLRKGERGLILSTAHPAKFPETIDRLIPGALQMPERLKEMAERTVKSISIPANMEAVRAVLLR